MNNPTPRLSGRIALVTGASRGIGAAVAARFAAEGAHVYALARNREALAALGTRITDAGGACTMVPTDITDGAALDRLGGMLAERHARLDVLVGNAALLTNLTPLGHVRPHDWNRVIDVNLNANWRVLRSVDPLLRQSDAGRAMFVTSGVGHRPRAYWGAYAVSKAGLEMLARIYAEEVSKTAIRVNIVDPGVVRTGMRARAMPGEDPDTLPTPEMITDCFVALAEPSCKSHGEVVQAQGGGGAPAGLLDRLRGARRSG